MLYTTKFSAIKPVKFFVFSSLKDGTALKEDGRVSVNRDAGPNGSYEITIKKVEAGDAGTYSVKATNNFGAAECSAKVGCKGNLNPRILSI